MCNSNLRELGKLDLPKGHLQRVFNYHWKDRPNKRDYYAKVLEDGRLLGFICCDKDGLILQELDFTKLDCIQNLWYLPTCEHPVILNQTNNIFYELGVPKLRKAKIAEGKQEEETEVEKGKVFWYEFFDERNQRIYEVGFHVDGDLVGYTSYGNTKDEVLHQLVPIEDAASYRWEDLIMVGSFERVPEPDREPPND